MTEQNVGVRVNVQGKSTIIAYVLWWFFGFFGVHRLYLGRTGSGFMQFLLFISGWLTAWIVIGILPLCILGIWWLIDALLIYGIIEEENEKLGLSQGSLLQYTKQGEIVSESSKLDQLEKLYSLHEKGILTEDEYKTKKANLLT